MIQSRVLLNSSILRVSGVLRSSAEEMSWLILPTSVASPVATTTPEAVPFVARDDANARLTRSASGQSRATGPASLSTGTDSPVRADSSTRSSRSCSRRTSAGTLSPAWIRTMSPGTSSSAGSTSCSPARTTVAWAGHRAAQRLDGGHRLGLLEVADEGVEQDDADDDAGVDPVPEEEGHDAGGQQDQNERVEELTCEAHEVAGALGRRELVGPELLQAVLDGEQVEAPRCVCLEEVDDLLGRKRVPVLVGEGGDVRRMGVCGAMAEWRAA